MIRAHRSLLLHLVCILGLENKIAPHSETETEFIAKFKKLKKIIYNTMIVMNLAKEPGEASL